MKLLKKLDANLEKWLMLAALAGITLLLGIQVFSRFVLNNSLTWSEELSRFLLIWSAFLSIGFCIRTGISLKIDTLISVFSPKIQAVLLILGDLVCAAFFLYMLPSAWEFAYTSVRNGQVSAGVGIPMYLVQASVFAGFALAAWRSVQSLWKEIRILTKKGEE